MTSLLVVIIGSGNGLLPNGTKLLTEPIMIYNHCITPEHLREISMNMYDISCQMIWKLFL